jgi:hypothetical protein
MSVKPFWKPWAVRTLSILATTLYFLSVFTAHAQPCNTDYPESSQRQNCQKEWTVLIYMAAENNLAPYALWDLYEMEAGFESGHYAGSTKKLDLLVQYETTQNQDVQRYHIRQSSAQYDRKLHYDTFVNHDSTMLESPIIEHFSKNNSKTESQKFKDFLKWGKKNYPSKNLMVILWGHGKGFSGLAYNDRTQNHLTVRELKNSLSTALEGQPIDVYVSDACLMQTIEVASELSQVHYIVGSSNVQSYQGLPYRRMFYEINRGTYGGFKNSIQGNDAGLWVAHMLPKLMKDSLTQQGLQYPSDQLHRDTFTSSTLNGMVLQQELLPAFKLLSRDLWIYLQEDPLRIADIKSSLMNTSSYSDNIYDLNVFLSLIESQLLDEKARGSTTSVSIQNLSKSLAQTQLTVQKTVLDYMLGDHYRQSQEYLLGARGLSLWLPLTSDSYRTHISEMNSIPSFFKDSNYLKLLKILSS